MAAVEVEALTTLGYIVLGSCAVFIAGYLIQVFIKYFKDNS